MDYFSHHVSPFGRVWSLFSELHDINSMAGVTNNGLIYGHATDIIHAAMSGSISMDEESVENFNLSAYEYGCFVNEEKVRFKKRKKELFIVDDSNIDSNAESPRLNFGDISSRRLGHRDKNLDIILDIKVYDDCMQGLIDIRDKVIIDYGVDLVVTLSGALKGINESISILKAVTNQDSEIEDVVSSLISSAAGGTLEKRLKALM